MSKLIFYFSDDAKKRVNKVFEREEELARKGVTFRTVCAGRMDELMSLSDDRLAVFKEYIICDAGDLSTAQADFVTERLRDKLALDVTAVGRRRDDAGKVPGGAMVFLAGADEIKKIEEEGTAEQINEPEVIRQSVEPVTDSHTFAEEEPEIPKELAMFLEADTATDRLDVFRRIKEKCDDHIIDTIAVILDMEIPEGDLERRRRDVITCLETKVKYELTRR